MERTVPFILVLLLSIVLPSAPFFSDCFTRSHSLHQGHKGCLECKLMQINVDKL